MGIHSPLPSNLGSECRKVSKILASFIDPRQAFGPDKIIPPSILANAKGLAIITVIKAGLLFSGRVGSGLVIARLPDGSWSAPSAVATAGAGFGGQIGAELTDFVMILNDAAAVKTFSQAGSLTLGGNVSIAAGPVGRNAEASGMASLRSVAAVFSYSKTRGAFAGVSIEGSVIVERRDANKKFYAANVTAKQLLSGTIPAPQECDSLMRILDSRVFRSQHYEEDIYNDVPIYDDVHDDNLWEGNRGDAMGERSRNNNNPTRTKRASTWQDDVYDRDTYNQNPSRRDDGNNSFVAELSGGSTGGGGAGGGGGGRMNKDTSFQRQHFLSTYSDEIPTFSDSNSKISPGRPSAPKPSFNKPSRSATLGANQAIALYTFEASQAGDLGFKKGDVITITKRTDSKNDWWEGQFGGRTGIFPSNYVEAV